MRQYTIFVLVKETTDLKYLKEVIKMLSITFN